MLQLVSCTCPVLHALFFSLQLELLEGRVRAYSRGPTELAQQTYTGGLSLCPPFLSGQGHPHVLGFLCGLRFPFLLLSFSLLLPLLLPLNFSFSSSSSFLPPPSLPACPLLPPFFLPPSPVQHPQAGQLQFPRRPAEGGAASAGPQHCARASCEVRWEEADWEPRRVDAAEPGSRACRWVSGPGEWGGGAHPSLTARAWFRSGARRRWQRPLNGARVSSGPGSIPPNP